MKRALILAAALLAGCGEHPFSYDFTSPQDMKDAEAMCVANGGLKVMSARHWLLGGARKQTERRVSVTCNNGMTGAQTFKDDK